jgi:tetratricopeptide (TPR) repeat protein
MPHKTRSRKPEDWLEDGNRSRAQKAWRDADESYARAIYAAPQSSAAYVARVASAGLHLDHLRDPRGALGRYRGALRARPNGPLSEEARYGIAECYRALKDREGERAALEAFLQKHPDAGLAGRARRRVLELQAGD